MWKIFQRIFHVLRKHFSHAIQPDDGEAVPRKEDSSKASVERSSDASPASSPTEPETLPTAPPTKVDPCQPVLDLIAPANGQPVLLIGYYHPDRQEHPTDAWFSHLILYPYARKKSDLLVFTPSACVKDARALADQLIAEAPAQKKYQMLLVVHPAACNCQGTACGILQLAFDVTPEPILFRPGEKLTAPKNIARLCFHPDLRPYLKKKQPTSTESARSKTSFRNMAPKTKDEIQIERWNRMLKQKQSPTTFQQDFIRTPLMEIAEQANGRPIILYGTFIDEKRTKMVRSCFRDIKPFFPDVPERSIKVITDHLMIEDAGNRAYSFGQIRQKTERYGTRVLLIGYPHLYINKGFLRCGFRLAKNLGINAILYNHARKAGRFVLPEAVLAKCYLPDAKIYC